jgi:hypothetical protein
VQGDGHFGGFSFDVRPNRRRMINWFFAAQGVSFKPQGVIC